MLELVLLDYCDHELEYDSKLVHSRLVERSKSNEHDVLIRLIKLLQLYTH